MTALPIAAPWFARTTLGPGLTHLTEPHVHPLLRCNVWHVRGRDRDALIDTGLGVASLRAAAADLFEHDLLAVATHAHMDHMGGLHEFADRACHAAEAEAVATAEGNLPLDVGLYDEPTLEALAAWGYDVRAGLLTAIPDATFRVPEHHLIGATATRLLADGDVVDLGDRAFEVLHLPGHSPGSIGLFDRPARTLFSGDAVYDGPLLDALPGSDVAAYIATMQRLRALPVDVVYAGHGPVLDRVRLHTLIDDYLRSRGA